MDAPKTATSRRSPPAGSEERRDRGETARPPVVDLDLGQGPLRLGQRFSSSRGTVGPRRRERTEGPLAGSPRRVGTGSMRWLRRSWTVAALLCLGFVTLAPAAVAQGDDGPDSDDQIVLTGRLVVPEGETAQTAVLFSGEALIDGTVGGWLVVFNGRTVITGTVDKDVVVFAGDVVLRSGSRVGGDVISLEDPQIEEGATVEGSVDDLATRWNLYDITFGGRFAWWLAYTISTLVLGPALLFLALRLDRASIRAIRDRRGAAIGFGLLVFVLLPILAGLLVGTIVGIPLGLFLLLALALVYSIGYVVCALALGRLVVKEPTSRYVAFLAGWGALRVIALVPILGGIAWTVATVLGLGTLWVAARGASSDTRPVAPPVAPPVPS
jgi:nitrate reductase NapE component